MFCIAAESVFELIVPLLMARLVDVGVQNADESYIYVKGVQMLICAVLALVLGAGSARFAALAGQGLGAELFFSTRERRLGEIDSSAGQLGRLRRALAEGDQEGLREMFRKSTRRRAEFDRPAPVENA